MKTWLIGLLCFGLLHPVFAFDLKEKMYLSEHYFSYTTSFDVSSEDKKLGTLYRRMISLNAIYDFYDLQNRLISSAQSHFFSFNAHVDVYNENEILIGTIEEQLFSWFPTYDLYLPDGTRLGHATMNFWGTKFTLYEGAGTTTVLVEMSRDFFRLKNNWTINIKDMDRVKTRQIDSRVLMTVLAVQCDKEYLERYLRNQREQEEREREKKWQATDKFFRPQARILMNHTEPTQTAQVLNLRNKFSDFLKKEEELTQVILPDEQKLNALATQLDTDFQQQYAGIMMNATEKSEQFVDYCTNIAQSNDTPPETKKAILHLLQKRISEQAEK